MGNDAMLEVIGAVWVTESDLKYNEAVEKIINQLHEEVFDEL